MGGDVGDGEAGKLTEKAGAELAVSVPRIVESSGDLLAQPAIVRDTSYHLCPGRGKRATIEKSMQGMAGKLRTILECGAHT